MVVEVVVVVVVVVAVEEDVAEAEEEEELASCVKYPTHRNMLFTYIHCTLIRY